MIDTAFYRIIDAVDGAMIALLLFFVCRLLLVRKDGPLRVRYIAAALLLLTVVEAALYFFLDDAIALPPVAELLCIWMDALALVIEAFMIWLLWRNRHSFSRTRVFTGGALLAVQILFYLFCAAMHFAEWTYLIYMPLSALMWMAFAVAVDRMLAESVADKKPEREALVSPAPFSADPLLQELEQLLLTDRLFCREDLTRDEVCRLLHTNRTTLSKRLNEATGKTFSEYLRDMRLAEAARILRTTDLPVDQVAFEVGLRSASGFHRNFLFSYGMTPNQYRREAGKTEKMV